MNAIDPNESVLHLLLSNDLWVCRFQQRQELMGKPLGFPKTEGLVVLGIQLHLPHNFRMTDLDDEAASL